MLSFLQTKKNNVTHVTIEFVFNELAYDFKINDIFDLLTNLSSKNYNQLRQLKRKKTKFVMTFVVALNKSRYDVVHQALNIKIKNKIYFRFYQNYIISNLFNHKFFHQRIKFFTIFEKIDNFAFRFQLSSIMKIHSMIFIAQLKSITKKSNSYERKINIEPPSVKKKNNSTFHYEIEKLLNKRVSREQLQYFVK